MRPLMKKAVTLAAVCGLLLLLPLSVYASMNKSEVEQEILARLTSKIAEYGLTAHIKYLSPVGEIKDGATEVKCIFPQSWNGLGDYRFAAIIKKDRSIIKNLAMTAGIQAYRRVVVATRAVRQGDIVTEEDVAVQDLPVTKELIKALFATEDAVGKKALVDIEGGNALTKENLAKVLLIKTGKEIDVKYEDDELSLTVRGIARTSGGKGDAIRVQNPSTNRLINATIVDATTAVVQ